MNRDAFFSHDKAHLDCCRKSLSVVDPWWASETSQTQLKHVVIFRWTAMIWNHAHFGWPVYRGVWLSFWLENIFAHRFIDIFHLSNEEGQWGISDFQNLNLAMCLQNIPMCYSGTRACYNSRKLIILKLCNALRVQHTAPCIHLHKSRGKYEHGGQFRIK